MSRKHGAALCLLTFLALLNGLQGSTELEQGQEDGPTDFDVERDENDIEMRRYDEPDDNMVGEDGSNEDETDNDVDDDGQDDEANRANMINEEDVENNIEEGDNDDDDEIEAKAAGKDCNVIQNEVARGVSKCSKSSDMCEMDLQPIGCFYDPVVRHRPMPILLVSHRDRTSHAFNGVVFNWKDAEGSIKRLLCDCVKVAKKRGLSYIGLQHYGECWGGKNAAKTFDKHGRVKSCVNGNYKPCKGGEFCTGKGFANYVYAINSMNPVNCDINYENSGCFYDPVKIKNRPLPYLLESRRDRTSHAYYGKLISWRNYRQSLAELVCSCAQRAKAKGFKYFGIQYFGECWSGPGSTSYRKYGTSHACKSAAFQKCKGYVPGCLCTGDQHSNFVYSLV